GAQLLFGHGEIGGRPYPAFNDDASVYLIGYYFFLNATAHFCQALLAINVLATCTAVSYSIASLMKRVVVITIALLWFQQPVSGVQAFGILLTFYGLWLYDRAKSDVKATERQADNVYSASGGLMLLPWSIKQV
ncbi:triose-phosphate transporter family-domain-containing protein, partial [Syncephalis pseudoplumigaleata]